jgi:hypothetical protein
MHHRYGQRVQWKDAPWRYHLDVQSEGWLLSYVKERCWDRCLFMYKRVLPAFWRKFPWLCVFLFKTCWNKNTVTESTSTGRHGGTWTMSSHTIITHVRLTARKKKHATDFQFFVNIHKCNVITVFQGNSTWRQGVIFTKCNWKLSSFSGCCSTLEPWTDILILHTMLAALQILANGRKSLYTNINIAL